MPTMRLSLLLGFCSSVFVSWLITFSLECYYRGPPGGSSVHPKEHEPPYPGATDDNIFWFLQISDIHLSTLNKLEVGKDLQSFCTKTVTTISPALILVTGDLTHALFTGEGYSQQMEEEWKAYRDIVTETKVAEGRPWLDIRGNHDAFDVESLSHDNNMYLRYSASHTQHNSYSYSYTHSTEFGSYRFIGVDACPSPGPRRPFNFFGVLHDEDLASLRSLVSAPSPHSPLPNATVWFSHYPSATITTDHRALRQLMSSSVAHVCGHLHTAHDLMFTMYGRHPNGHLELELVDFKDNRRYRLMAMDHDLFSFTDTRLDRWPLVLVTNPKDSRFTVPGREPLGRVAQSTHVRVLAFSPSGIKSVKVWLDGLPLSPTTRVRNGPLYTTPWDPAKVASGLHTITVVVEDVEHNLHNSSHQFSLDGHMAPLSRLPQLVLLTDVRALFRMFFLFLWLSLLSTLTLSWINRDQPVYFQPLVREKTVFYLLMTLLVYLGTGPWCVAELMTGVYGVIWAHGVQVSSHFIPGSLTYLYGSTQLLLWYIPLTCYLNRLLSPPSRTWCPSLCHPILCHATMLFLFYYHCGWCKTFAPYGTVALILSPGVSWTIPLSLYLIFRSWKTHFRTTTNRAI